MLASRFPTILSELSDQARFESAVVYSVLGEDIAPLLSGMRPFRSPHHSATAAGLVGGGSPPHPGEVSLAHNGVLFLDELSEFSASVLQTLRQPMETGRIHITRADGTYVFPARFMLLAATNPCPCGYYGDPSGRCRCSASTVQAYQNRIGGPLLDRIDIRIDVWRADNRELMNMQEGKTSADLKEGVLKGQAYARDRLRRVGAPKATMRGLKDACCFDVQTEEFFLSLAEGRDLSARAVAKTLKLARSIADIAQVDQVTSHHVAEAFGLRFGGGVLW